MKRSHAHEIAFAGVSTALALICATLSCYVEVMSLTFAALGGIAIMLPLTVGSLRSACLAYTAAAALSFAVAPFPLQMPFVLLFGLYGVLYFVIKKIKFIWIRVLLKIAYFNLILFALYSFMGLILSDFWFFGIELEYWMVAVFGTLLFLVYDFVVSKLFQYLCAFVDRHITR